MCIDNLSLCLELSNLAYGSAFFVDALVTTTLLSIFKIKQNDMAYS